MIDYRKYRVSRRSLICAGIIGGMGGTVILAFFLPGGWSVGGIAGAVIGTLYWQGYKRRRMMEELRYEFQECLEMMLPVLRTGRSIEGTVEAVCEDMNPEEFRWLYNEMKGIHNGLKLQESIEELFKNFGERSGIEDIQDFAEILYISKRSGGEIAEAMRHTIQILEEKMEAEEELRVILSKRKLEQRILMAMPFGIIAMLRVMSPGYLEPLYTTLQGGMVTILCILLMGVSGYLSMRISKISA